MAYPFIETLVAEAYAPERHQYRGKKADDNGRFKWYWNSDHGITPKMVLAHYSNCLDYYGGSLVDRDGKTRVLVLDFDDHEKRVDYPTFFAYVAHASRVLHENNIEHLVEVSGSGHGFHIWIVFDKKKSRDRYAAADGS